MPQEKKTISPSVVYVKTSKGQAEIHNRAYHMPPRIRALLLMIDGSRPASEWIEQAMRMGGGEDWLQYLLSQGFIRDSEEAETLPEPPIVKKADAVAELQAPITSTLDLTELTEHLREAKSIMRYCVRNCTGFGDSRVLNKLLDQSHNREELIHCLNSIVEKLKDGPQAAMITKMREQVMALLK